ncbi:group II intron reverse transcriptase/maturase [Streptomyces jumonjinensis]|uniref:group II intron reverse transcriptase/maturase n=1 Tax=Streptomyces jumonjinensis TaxID=1945 RepID=UPI00379C7E0D
MQRKLHQWAVDEPGRTFDDLFNLVHDPSFLVVAWERVRTNKGARSAGVDGEPPRALSPAGVMRMLMGLREEIKERRFRPDPVREVTIPKANGSKRRLGIATTADRVVQASLKLVLEPIFEADFVPCSYGFRPRRRAQDAIAEIHRFTTMKYHWVFEADIAACFDEIDHAALLARVRGRIADRRVLTLVRAFLKAGILSEDLVDREALTGTPQGGILSPLLSNIALSVLDEHFHAKWHGVGSAKRRQRHIAAGGSAMRIIRYADDFVIVVHGKREHAEALWGEVAAVLEPMGLRLSVEKTRVVHIDEGFDFLGFRIQRKVKRGTNKRYIYTWPSKKSLASVIDKVRQVTRMHRHRKLANLLRHLNPILRGWCNYFKHGVSKRTFSYVGQFAWWRVVIWLRKRHKGLSWGAFVQRVTPGWEIRDGKLEMFHPRSVSVTRYRYRGAKITTPWTARQPETATPMA